MKLNEIEKTCIGKNEEGEEKKKRQGKETGKEVVRIWWKKQIKEETEEMKQMKMER